MTPAERMRRYRWMKAIIKGWCDRRRVRAEVNWMRDGPADMIGSQIAWSCFDFERHIPNYERWQQISAKVVEHLMRLEDDFAHLRIEPK